MEEQEIIIKKNNDFELKDIFECGQCFRWNKNCLLYTSQSPRDPKTSRMPSSA